MVSLFDFVADLLGSTVRLVVIFATEVLPNDPLSAIVFLIGGALTTFSIAFFGYLVLGAVGELFGGLMPSPGRTPPPRE
ncbi:hypothetical protein [Halegenticoccus tardaugens]|uniref:hypothetical protein n=1 Tax=Halegenticoccus tardaugens TaxID=2071624 RepID=UPI00100BA3E3|nr:hypothetical protein [Halegenticoccus tardaugens]